MPGDPENTASPARRNLTWVLSGRVVQIVVAFVVSIAVARYLGPDLLGQLGFAAAFAGLFIPLGLAGAQFVVRDLAVSPDGHRIILGSAAMIGGVAGVGSFLLAVGSAALLLRGQPDAVTLVAILSAPLLVTPLKATEYWFEAALKSKYLVLGRSTALFAASALRIAAIVIGADVTTFAVLVAAEQLLATAMIAFLFLRDPDRPPRWTAQLQRTTDLARRALPLLVATVAIAIYMRIDQVMLGALSSDEETGIYTAAVRLSEVANFIPIAVAGSFAPGLARLHREDPEAYGVQTQRMLTLLTGLALGIAIPVALLAPFLVPILLGSAFAATGIVLSIHILSNIFVFLGVGESVWTTNEELQRLAMWRAVGGAMMNVALNFLFIPWLGATGAAIATLISYGSADVLANLLHPATRPMFWMELRSFSPRRLEQTWRPELARFRRPQRPG